MIIARHLSITLVGLALACGDDSSGTPGDTTTSADDSTGSASTSMGPTTNPTQTTTPDDTGPPDTTAGVNECAHTIRYPLFDGQGCGRVVVGDIDNDGFGDVVAFGRDPDALLGPVSTTLQTFLGGNLGLESAEVSCCFDASLTGPRAAFDINGDGREDPMWASERVVFSGDVGSTELTMEKAIRGPQGGYTGGGTVFAAQDSAPAPVFAVGRITPQELGVLAVANGGLLSLSGNGSGLGLDTVRTLALDPFPTVWAISTIELDGEQGVDVAGVGPDGLLLWGGSLDGTFTDATVTALPGNYTHIEAIDLDLNGSRQLVLFGQGEPVALVDSDGDGGIVITTEGTPMLDPPATVIEVNNDFYPDLVGVVGGNLVMFAGDGDSFPGAPVILAPIGEATDVAFGDFDGDLRADVVACDEQGLLVVYRVEE